MTLRDIEIDSDARALPVEVERLLASARPRIDDYLERATGAAAFVPSDFDAAYRAMRSIAHSHLLTGRRFCELGSGFGVVACLAATLGLEVSGIEVEPDLVAAAQSLAAEMGLAAQFVCGSFIPADSEAVINDADELGWLTTGRASAYEELGLDLDDFDLIYAFPWPGEKRTVEQLFERHAGVGALLLTYQGFGEMRLQRKLAAKRKRR